MNRFTNGRKLSACLGLGVGAWILAGCAGPGPAGPVMVRTHVSNPIFLNVSEQGSRTVFVDVSDEGAEGGVGAVRRDLEDALKQRLQDEGYTVLPSPPGAGYVLQTQIRWLGERDSADLGAMLGAGFGGEVLGGLVGGRGGAGLGLLAGLIAGSTVRDVHYTLVTDVQITERDADGDRWRTRVVTWAGQTDLAFPDAEPALVDRQAAAIAGFF